MTTNPIQSTLRQAAVRYGIILFLSFVFTWTVQARPGSGSFTGGSDSPSQSPLSQEAGGEKLKKIIRRVAPAVVTVYGYDEHGEAFSLGSGFVVGDEGLVITNYHVVKYAFEVEIKTKSGIFYRSLGMVGFDVERDVAVLKINATGLPSVTLGSAQRMEMGDAVIAIGHPHGLEHTVSTGIISQRRQYEQSSFAYYTPSMPNSCMLNQVRSLQYLQHTASISSGSSGGPLLDEEGRVIGINTLTMVDGQNLNFAMPIDYVHALLQGGSRVRYDFASVSAWQLRCDVASVLDVYKDPRGFFSLAFPKTWLVDQQGYWNADKTVHYSYTMFAPTGALHHEVMGYLSEGIRIRVEEPQAGRTFTVGTVEEYGPYFIEDVLASNSGFALTRSEVIPVGHLTANVYEIVGQNENIPEPEKTTFIVLADQQRRMIIEMVSPASKLADNEALYTMLLSTFEIIGLTTASN